MSNKKHTTKDVSIQNVPYHIKGSLMSNLKIYGPLVKDVAWKGVKKLLKNYLKNYFAKNSRDMSDKCRCNCDINNSFTGRCIAKFIVHLISSLFFV